MKKLYQINNKNFGIDLSSVLCFYIDGEIDTYHCKMHRYLRLHIADMSSSNNLVFIYSTAVQNRSNIGCSYYEEKIDENVNKLYNDLIEYYK